MKLNTTIDKGMQVLAILLAGLTFTAVAGAQTVADRKENQQDRIGQGVNSGQLTAGESSHLEGQESALNHETRAMRSADGGKLTAGDKRVISHQQNHLSREIYRDKHNGRKQ